MKRPRRHAGDVLVAVDGDTSATTPLRPTAAEQRRARVAAWASMRALEARHREHLRELRESLVVIRAAIPAAFRARWEALRAEHRPRARPPRAERPRCGARRRDGGACAAPVVWRAGEPAPRGRCRAHGGAAPGPRPTKPSAARLRARAEAVRVADGRVTVVALTGRCEACTVAAKRSRGVVRAYVGRVRAGVETAGGLVRVIGWTRCPAHAREAREAFVDARRIGVAWTVEFSTPCP